MSAILSQLLVDLVWPGELPPQTLAGVASAISSLDLNDAQLCSLFAAMVNSTSLWKASLQDVFSAVQYGIMTRLHHIQTVHGSGWNTRRRLGNTLDRICSTLRHSPSTSAHPLAVVIASATLAGLQAQITRKAELATLSTWATSKLEKQVVAIWAEAAPVLTACDQEDVAWLACQCLPDVPSEHLGALCSEPFLDFAFSHVRDCFFRGSLFEHLAHDLEQTSEGLLWKPDSPSYARLQQVIASPTYNELGRFSRVIGKVIESSPMQSALQIVLRHFEHLESDILAIQRDWEQTKWSNVSSAEDLHPDTRSRNEPWTILKTLLFTTTMIYASLISLLNSLPLSSSSSPAILLSSSYNTVVDLAACSLRTFASLYFVTQQFGTDGFGAYKGVWYGTLDLIVHAKPEGKVQEIVQSIQPKSKDKQKQPESSKGDNNKTPMEEAVVSRSRITYYLNAVEQLVLPLSDEYLEQAVVPIALPYLASKRYLETFEAAHSVLLAIYARRKKAGLAVAVQYTNILLSAYLSLMNLSQLRLAFSTMISCLCETDPSLACYCIDALCNAIAAIPNPAPLMLSHDREADSRETESTFADLSNGEASREDEERMLQARSETPGAAVDNLVEESTTRLEEASSSDELERSALRSPRGHLLIVLIDQASSVTDEFLDYVLDRVQWFLGEEASAFGSGGARQTESRHALYQILFKTIATGMDMTKRQDAAKWFLQYRRNAEILEGHMAKL